MAWSPNISQHRHHIFISQEILIEDSKIIDKAQKKSRFGFNFAQVIPVQRNKQSI